MLSVDAQFLEHGIHHGLAVPFQRLPGAACHMHTCQKIIQRKQRVIGSRRFSLEHVQTGCGDLSRGKRVVKRIFVDQTAARLQ